MFFGVIKYGFNYSFLAQISKTYFAGNCKGFDLSFENQLPTEKYFEHL